MEPTLIESICAADPATVAAIDELNRHIGSSKFKTPADRAKYAAIYLDTRADIIALLSNVDNVIGARKSILTGITEHLSRFPSVNRTPISS
jgi:hypothetical protein